TRASCHRARVDVAESQRSTVTDSFRPLSGSSVLLPSRSEDQRRREPCQSKRRSPGFMAEARPVCRTQTRGTDEIQGTASVLFDSETRLARCLSRRRGDGELRRRLQYKSTTYCRHREDQPRDRLVPGKLELRWPLRQLP